MIVRITRTGLHKHTKASERYVSVVYEYDDGEVWEGWIPIEYRRTGTSLAGDDQIKAHLEAVAPFCHSGLIEEWRSEQASFWRTKPNASVTKSFYDVLESFRWSCTGCAFPASSNPARRYQDLKEFGYTLATNKSRRCTSCGRTGAHILMVPIPRGGISGYESWSPALRKRIVKVLGAIDVYEGKRGSPDSLIPDHKFPEIRWDLATRQASLETLTDDEIRHKFQLLTNQRNLQKREVCRSCYQTEKRGFPFGIKYFYSGDENWPKQIPPRGRLAEQGCDGCGWYDLALWRSWICLTIDNLAVKHSQT